MEKPSWGGKRKKKIFVSLPRAPLEIRLTTILKPNELANTGNEMNNTLGFINASQWTHKIVKTGSRSRRGHWSFFSVFTRHLSARDPSF